MKKKPPEKKGFAGFDDLGSDHAADAPEPVKPPAPAPVKEAAPIEEPPEPQPAAPKILEKADELDIKEPIERFKMGGYWWVVAAVVVIGLIIANADKKDTGSNHAAPTTHGNDLNQTSYPALPEKYNHHDETPAEPAKPVQAAPVNNTASFDCGAAKSTLEIVICSDAELAALDGKVGEAYHAAQQTAVDKNSLLTAQRAFLKSRTTICSIPYKPNILEYEANNLVACLKRQYTARLSVLQQLATPAPAAKTSPSDLIALATGLMLRHVNAAGYPIAGNDYNPGNKFIVNYQGRTLLEDDSSAYVNFESLNFLGDEQVVLLSQASGGNACNATYKLISIYDGMAHVSQDFGNCSVPEVTKTANDELIFIFYDGYGKRLVNQYKNHQMTEEKINVPLKRDPDSANGFNYLKKYAAKNDVESMLQDRKLNPQLVDLLGMNWEGFKQRLDLYSVTTTEKFIIVTGLMAHSGGSDEAMVMIGLDGSELYAATLETDYGVKPPLQTIHAYSNQPALYSVAPQEMQTWIANFKTPNVQWKYAK